MTRSVLHLAIMLFCSIATTTTHAEDTFTAPETIVNVKIEPFADGRQMILTGARLFFETTQASYHVESQREQSDLANRTQDVALLQSKLIRYGVHQLNFRSVGGEELSIDEVISRLKKNPLALMLPFGASIHPQLAAAFNPDTIIMIRADGKPSPQRLIPRPNGG